MCLTIPKKVIAIKGDGVIVETAGGNRQKLKSIVLSLEVGDWVLSQQQIILEKIDKKEAKEALKILEEV
ncbi:MAG TPA: HypC/HybG/HupF family hydrogenase formation chaperone [Candidatus Moranbacteria bacterium]|nr:HypC/HybG/HupF family hydrogenase formation chaperone [Candidatus Moranbacteria bacterium]